MQVPLMPQFANPLVFVYLLGRYARSLVKWEHADMATSAIDDTIGRPNLQLFYSRICTLPLRHSDLDHTETSW